MTNVLLVVHTKTFFPRMLELGKLLSKSDNFRPIFHFAYKTGWIDINEDIAILAKNQFDLSCNTKQFNYREVYALSEQPDIKSFLPPKLRKFIRAIIRPSILQHLAEFVHRLRHENVILTLARIRKRLAEIDQILVDDHADIVVISSDVPHWDTGVFIRASRLRNIPTVVLFSQTGPLDEAANVCSRIWHLSTKLPLNYMLSKIYPKWVTEKDGKKFLMMGFGETLAKELFKATMPQPWIESSSNANAVMIENKAYLQRGIDAGLKADNLYMTGYPFHDILFEGMSNPQKCLDKIYSIHDLPAGKPILLTSLLPNYTNRDSSRHDFPDYSEMVEFWIQSLVQYGQFYTLVSLHPSQKRSDYSYIEKMGATIARLPIPEIMPVCYAYIASLSSTITMAAACGKPVINYDYAHYHNTHYKDAPGVILVESKHEFLVTLDKLLRDTDFYSSVASAQIENAVRWGNIDGKAGERITKLFNDMARKY